MNVRMNKYICICNRTLIELQLNRYFSIAIAKNNWHFYFVIKSIKLQLDLENLVKIKNIFD